MNSDLRKHAKSLGYREQLLEPVEIPSKVESKEAFNSIVDTAFAVRTGWLFSFYGVEDNNFEKLFLRVAMDWIPGFNFVQEGLKPRPVGRPATKAKHELALAAAIEQILAEQGVHGVTDACRRFIRRIKSDKKVSPSWRKWLQTKDGELSAKSVAARYYEAKPQWDTTKMRIAELKIYEHSSPLAQLLLTSMRPALLAETTESDTPEKTARKPAE